jgi:hypothetical protein
MRNPKDRRTGITMTIDPLELPHSISKLYKVVDPALFAFLGKEKGIRRAIDGTDADSIDGLPRLRAVRHGRKIGVTLRALLEYLSARNVASKPEPDNKGRKSKEGAK